MYLHILVLFNFIYFVKLDCVVVNNTRPSPIDIKTSEVTVKYLPPLKWNSIKKYSKKETFDILNTGHAIVVRQNSTTGRYLSGGDLGEIYQFQQFSFHWGTDDSKGSEHRLNGHQFPMEMQCRHVQYKTATLDEYAIVTFFVNITKEDNDGFDPILDALPRVPNINDTGVVYNFSPIPLLNTNFQAYYQYEGSTTIPPYAENIKFLIVSNPIGISERQIQKFRDAADRDTTLQNNFECTQKLLNREVDLVIQDELLRDYC